MERIRRKVLKVKLLGQWQDGYIRCYPLTPSFDYTMKGILLTVTLFFAIVHTHAQTSSNPAVPHYGAVFAQVPGLSFTADKNLPYKVVIEIDKSDTGSAEISQSLEIASRFVNLLAVDGISQDKRSIVIIFHNAGSYCLQKNEAYQRKYGRPNPNLQILEELTKAGVSFMVCGQSTVKRKLLPEELLPQVKIATSYMTAFVTHQLKGYAAMKM
ncbi:DsrE family protein [Phnomibacter sp. MR]|uniref:DsrE family protein n=1 Tax=Phnomibacter sp. MR TaxID=3042318 RepID=UPI003A8119AB